MSFLKKLFKIKSQKEEKGSSLSNKHIDIENILKGNDKPEILFKSRVILAIGGDKELNDGNAFNTMGIFDEKLKAKILEYYVWQSFGEDIDFTSSTCTMQLVRIDVKEKYKPQIDAETAVSAFFNALDEVEEKKDEIEIKDDPKLERFKQVPWMTDLRLKNVSICLNAGFRPASSLPTEFDRNLRPIIEIAQRLNAIKALVLWLMIPEENLNSNKILNFIEKNSLKDFMNNEEKEILDKSRDDDNSRNSIGWKFENAWSLAWFFGYKEPDIMGQMMTGEQMQEILMDYSCPLDETVEEWVKGIETLSEEELIQKEDLFYCLHNAVRSAQLGKETVPNGFDPMGNGGVIHERRHSLTWMLSKGISWQETDLST